MSLFIPVTLVSTSEIKSAKAIESHDHQITPLSHCQNYQFQKISPQVPNLPKFEPLPLASQNHNSTEPHQQDNCNLPQPLSRSKYLNIEPSMSCPKPTSQKSCEQQLQKKSTRSSLHQQLNLKSTSENHQNSVHPLKPQTQVPKLQKLQNYEQNLETQSDVLPQLICSCKICLQSSNELIYDAANNPILKVCNCIDYVHMKCLEAWITRRDVINEEIKPNQCEVCLAFYEIDLQLESFFSAQILCKHLKSDPKGLLCELIPSMVFFALLVAGAWVLGSLITERNQEGGKVRATLGMPYGTCVTIFIFLEFILSLVLGIFFYSWMRKYLMDFKFKIKVIKGEKSQANRLKKMLKNIK